MLTAGRRVRGVTLVELMVGLTIGLIVILAVAQFFVGEIVSNTHLLKVTRLNQELRTIMDLVVRDLRRTAYWGNAISGVWYEGTPGITRNPLQSITIGTTVDPSSAITDSSITYSYDVDGNGSLDPATETFTIQRDGTLDTIEMVQGQTATELSDRRNTKVTSLTFDATPVAVTVPCVVATGTPPVLTLREIAITITAQLKDDASVSRTLRETVRIRGDNIAGSCPPVI